jgi:hypothetical protein
MDWCYSVLVLVGGSRAALQELRYLISQPFPKTPSPRTLQTGRHLGRHVQLL